MLVAEADGNRTRQTEILGLTGFEDRGAHQDSDASVKNPTPACRAPAPRLDRDNADCVHTDLRERLLASNAEC